MAQAMALATVYPTELPAEYHKHYIGYIYRDILQARVLEIPSNLFYAP
jgi:hypothetical protein